MRNLAKVNPPPILYRYRRQNDWAIKELTAPEVHVAGVLDMNDPFEYRAPISIDVAKLKAAFFKYAQEELGLDQDAANKEVAAVNQQSVESLREHYEEMRKSSGLICCSSNPRSNRMWAYYADSHKGICVGYNTDFSQFGLAREVTYQDPNGAIDLIGILNSDPTLLSDQVSCRKGSEWAFEQEYRVPIGPIPNDHTRLLPIPKEAIVEIRLGINISTDFRTKVLNALKSLSHKPRIIQMGCDPSSFKLTETEAIGT